MLRKVFTVVLGLACVAVLYFGQSHWKQQMAASAKDRVERIDEVSTKNDDYENFTNYTKNWPENAVNRYKQTVNEEIPFHILFVGTPAIANTYESLKNAMGETFGERVQVDLQTSELTSAQFIEEGGHEELAVRQADMVVVEPFLLTDNGVVGIEDSLANLSLFVEAIKATNPDVALMLQPSFPLYNARFYPVQVERLKAYAEENQLTYLDHWSAWPDPKTEEVKEYLNEDQTAPSEKGYQVWSDYLLNYFISK